MQTGTPFAAACSQKGYVFGSVNQVAWSGSVLPVVNSRMPEQPRPSQWSNVCTASGAMASIEYTPVKRDGTAATASAT